MRVLVGERPLLGAGTSSSRSHRWSMIELGGRNYDNDDSASDGLLIKLAH